MLVACVERYAVLMSRPIQIRDVPDEVREGLMAKAEAAGVSLSAYLRWVLEREARRPSLRDTLATTGGHARDAAMTDIVDLLRGDREGSA